MRERQDMPVNPMEGDGVELEEVDLDPERKGQIYKNMRNTADIAGQKGNEKLKGILQKRAKKIFPPETLKGGDTDRQINTAYGSGERKAKKRSEKSE